MTLLYRTRRTEAHLGRCEDVLRDLTAARGAFASLAWIDGPYGMKKGEWDARLDFALRPEETP